MAPKPKKTSPTWGDVKRKMAEFDRAGLLGTIQDLYAASKDTRALPVRTQMPDAIVPPPPLPPVPPLDPPERDDSAGPDGQEDEPPSVLNRAAFILDGVYLDLDGRLTAAEASFRC